MFSSTTMAASTTMPTAKAKPARDTTLIERPRSAMATNEPITETGIAMAMITVAPSERRNSIRTMTAKVPPIQIFCCTSSIAESI